MPFIITLPTTSHVNLTASHSSATHPSLPLAATHHRSALRLALKQHKRLPPTSRPSHLPTVLSAIEGYLPYLLALEEGLSGRPVAGEEILITLHNEPRIQWRDPLAPQYNPNPTTPRRIKGLGLDLDLIFTLTTLALSYTALSAAIFISSSSSDSIFQTSTKHLLTAASIHTHISTLLTTSPFPKYIQTPSVIPTIHAALSSLALAVSTLFAVAQSDPYPASIIADLSPDDTSYLSSPPEIPKVRALLFVRLCIAASEHAAKAVSLLADIKGVDEGIRKYATQVRSLSRARAARMLGVDAERGGKMGEAIGWLDVALNELGATSFSHEKSSGPGGNGKGFSRLKEKMGRSSSSSKVPQSTSSTPSSTPDPTSKATELLVLRTLHSRWVKINDSVNTSPITPISNLLPLIPSGREIHTLKKWQVPELPEDEVSRMRAPVDPGEDVDAAADSSDEEDEDGRGMAGAFPDEGEGRAYY
ncbi:MAG: hypothetical protein M1834_004432 [Cirrosporium novae-zelandiae]|nr:MAG: hypothetical protein M1834_004432 [Cirrosporium novae-zelandiae]